MEKVVSFAFLYIFALLTARAVKQKCYYFTSIFATTLLLSLFWVIKTVFM